MSNLPTSEELMQKRAAAITEARAIAKTGVTHNRELSKNEQARFNELVAEAEMLEQGIRNVREYAESEKRTQDWVKFLNDGPAASGEALRYGVSDAALRGAWEAIANGGTTSSKEEFRALVTTTGMGSASSWATGSPDVGMNLRQFAGITIKALEGMTSYNPIFTLPTGAAGVNESTNHGEYDAAALSTLTATRYGRWSSISAAVKTFDDLSSLSNIHRMGIARDLDLADIPVLEAQAGTATVYAAGTFEQTLREKVLTVAAAVNADPTSLVVVGRPASLAVATGFQPANGGDRGSVSERIYGARIYASASAAASKLTIFCPAAYLAFESGTADAVTIDPKNGQETFGQWIHSTVVSPAFAGGAAALLTA